MITKEEFIKLLALSPDATAKQIGRIVAFDYYRTAHYTRDTADSFGHEVLDFEQYVIGFCAGCDYDAEVILSEFGAKMLKYYH